MLNTILGKLENGIRFYTKNKKCFDPNLYSERRFEELSSKGEVLKMHDDRNISKLDAYRRLLQHMTSNVIIPIVGHKSSITNMNPFVILALHEHRRMNFGSMAIEHMLATQTSSIKCLPYGCFLTKVFQYFLLKMVRVGDHIGIGKIYSKLTFKRKEFLRNEEGMLVRGGQEDNDKSDDNDEENEGQEAMNMGEEESEGEPKEETFRREMRQKKRQERVEEGQSSGNVSQLMEMIAFMQASMNSHFDALYGKISDIQERVMRLEFCKKKKDAQRGLKGNLQISKKSLKTTRLYEDEVIKLKTLKTRRMVRDSFISWKEERNLVEAFYKVVSFSYQASLELMVTTRIFKLNLHIQEMVFERTNSFKGNHISFKEDLSRRSSIKEHKHPSTFLTRYFPSNESRKLGIMPHIGVQEGEESTTKEIISRISGQHLRSKQDCASLASLSIIDSEKSHEKINN
ncbi:hypothetical protein M9H77_29791 [Catharanthus roseus]|uniref:Uncharacterized protein n=1 Tax=Catharanthus roseus TaxID=4058 RepID=A0ACB9ZXD4_CATRO|nr:hypothetical protein M9H77_29791 [Catharanthus roseus]